MSEYILVFIWLAAAVVISSEIGQNSVVSVCGEKVYRYSFIWALVVMLPIIWWAGNRGYVGDTWAYMRHFSEMPESWSQLSEYMDSVSKDVGFYGFSALIKIFITKNTTVYFFILAAIQGIILVKIYRKYSVNYMISIFLFVASSDCVSWMYNGVRQFLAVTITFLASEYIFEKKYVRAILVVLIASQVHATAVLVLPFMFIAQGRAWNKKTLLFFGSVLLAVTFVGEFTGLLNEVLEGTQYESVVSDWMNWQDNGTNALRVLVYSVPVLLAAWKRREIEEEDNPVINVCTNMSIISTGFYILSMFTSGIFIGRLPIYFSLYNYILLPWELEYVFYGERSRMMKAVMVVCYLGFYYMQMHFSWNLL